MLCPTKQAGDLHVLQWADTQTMKVADSNADSAVVNIDTLNRETRKKCLKRVLESLYFNIFEYGDNSMGNKPEGLCRVEYWLAHIQPCRITDGRI